MFRTRLLFVFAVLATALEMSAQDGRIVVMTKDTGLYNQTWFYAGSGNALQTEKIKDMWNNDKYIGSVAYTNVGWFVAMAKGYKWTDQSYNINDSWPDSWVQEKFRANYAITSLGASANKILVIMTKGTGYGRQQVCSAPWSKLSDWIKNRWNEGYYITSATCQNGLWTVVMTITTKFSNQRYCWGSTANEIKKKIEDNWADSYRITLFEYGGGEYFCVMSKNSDGTAPAESYNEGSFDVEKYVKGKWDDSYSITYIGG